MKIIICSLLILLFISCKQRPKIENISNYKVLFTRKINDDKIQFHLKIYSKLSKAELIKITTSRRRMFPVDTSNANEYIFWLANKIPVAKQHAFDEDYSYATIFYPHKKLEKSFVGDYDIDDAPCHISIKGY